MELQAVIAGLAALREPCDVRVCPSRFGEAISAAKQNGQRLHVAEQELYGTTAEIGAYLLGVWGLPYPIVEAVANHHAPERVQHAGLDALTAVHVADALASFCRETRNSLIHQDLELFQRHEL